MVSDSPQRFVDILCTERPDINMIETFLFVSSIISLAVAVWMYYDNVLLTKYLIESTEEKIKLMNELIQLHEEILKNPNTFFTLEDKHE